MEEPNALIRGAMFFFAGGDAGLCGAIIIALIVLLSFRPNRKPILRPFWILAGIGLGLLLIACGSSPLPIWFQLVTVLWLIAIVDQLRSRLAPLTDSTQQPDMPKISARRYLPAFTAIIWLVAILAMELPFAFPRLPPKPVTTLLVIGDSVTAGLNDGEHTWPRLLPNVARVEVLDASQPGATLRSARGQNELLSGTPGTMILEIGGNDMLEGLPLAKFENDLDRLLSDVVSSQRSVVMFELPLPPLCARYGLVQRRQASKHGVVLLPKRMFAKVLTTKGATVDSIHLSSRGQQQMMEMIRRFLGRHLVDGAGTCRRLERTSNIP